MKKIPIDYLHPHEDNIRKKFDKNKLKLLAKSIKEIGIIQPITMLKDGTIIAGHRRHKAAKIAGYKELKLHCRFKPYILTFSELTSPLIYTELIYHIDKYCVNNRIQLSLIILWWIESSTTSNSPSLE